MTVHNTVHCSNAEPHPGHVWGNEHSHSGARYQCPGIPKGTVEHRIAKARQEEAHEDDVRHTGPIGSGLVSEDVAHVQCHDHTTHLAHSWGAYRQYYCNGLSEGAAFTDKPAAKTDDPRQDWFREQEEELAAQLDRVNHPSHYGGDVPHEAIKCITANNLGFALGNATKYIFRAGKKGSTVEDLRKAIWYIEWEIKQQENDDAVR